MPASPSSQQVHGRMPTGAGGAGAARRCRRNLPSRLLAVVGLLAAVALRGADLAFYEDFESGDGGFFLDGVGSWEWGTVASGPGAAYSGASAWGTNLADEIGRASCRERV